ncbi:MAG: Uma2 family endonuclease [Chloroflexota bacterium]
MVIEKQAMSLEELLATGDDARFEIVEWERIDMVAAGMAHQIIAMNILRIIDTYVSERDMGNVLPDGMTFLMNSPTTGLKDSFIPDVSFVATDNIPADFDINKPHPGAPDLAVEIISPNDNVEIVQTKVETYLAQGTHEVWLVFPKTQTVHQYRQATPATIRKYMGQDNIETDLFPDMQGLTLKAIFALPAWAIKSDTKDNSDT